MPRRKAGGPAFTVDFPRDLPAEQKASLQKKLEEMRKAQARGLPAGQKFCPSCDGACRLAPKP